MEKNLIPRKYSIVTYKEEEEFYLKYEVNDIIPVVRDFWGHALHIILSFATLGLFALILIWNKKLWIKMRYRKAKIELATHIIVITEHKEEILIPKRTEFDENGNLKITLIYRYLKYIYENGDFIVQRNSLKLLHSEIVDMSDGIRVENYELLRGIFGKNSTKINVDSIMKIFTEEALSSFNIYQLFACFVWYFRDYMIYAMIILVFVFFSIVYEITLIRGEQKKINQMSVSTRVKVFRKKLPKGARAFVHFSEEIDSSDLVPGDVIEVTPDEKVPCDLVLLEGQCLIDESLLTGESVPMLKNQIPRNDDLFNDSNKENIIYAGTYCITSVNSKDKSQPARALVYQIGFGTTKGRLIRSIMFNDPGVYRFERDSNYFTLYLFLISMLFVAVYLYICLKYYSDQDWFDILMPSLDIILTMVPPGLSLSLSLGIEYAQSRLNKKSIVALKGRLINAAGRMKVVFFDKTGTLTINEMKLDCIYLGFPGVGNPQDRELLEYEEEYLGEVKEGKRAESKADVRLMMKHFAANHSLSYVNKEILGDPMEEELFKFCKAVMEDEEEDAETSHSEGIYGEYIKKVRVGKNHILGNEGERNKNEEDELYIMTILDFKSQLQRMSVIVKDASDKKNLVFTKGAPEKVIALCDPSSVPKELAGTIKTLSKHGFRILAFGYKEIADDVASNQPRDFYESNLQFQGISIFKNNLKEQTKPTIRSLKRADFKVGMITGDNINTAISIAKNCRLIELSLEEVGTYTFTKEQALVWNSIEETADDDSFDSESTDEIHGQTMNPSLMPTGERNKVGAIDSDNFSRIVAAFGLEEEGKEIDLKNPVLRELAKKCRVFARMDPDQKALIVKIMKLYHKEKETTVGFCGDGANDCIALKEADIGISLSQTEASLSAPFISAIEDISCVSIISAEGKAALTTNFDCFRFFCLYSIIQTIGLIVLFAKNTEYSDAVYIACDIFIALNLANCIGLLKPLDRLTSQLPQFTLFYSELMLSMVLNCVLAAVFFTIGIIVIKSDPDYKPPDEMVDPDKGVNPSGDVGTYETTMMGLYAMQTTFMCAIVFNIKGVFKQRFYTQVYMVISLIIYQIFVIYMLFASKVSSWVPSTKAFNDWLIHFFRVGLSDSVREFL